MNYHSFDVVLESAETLLAGIDLKNFFSFSEYAPGNCAHFIVENPCSFPCVFFHAQSSFDSSFFECWSVWSSLILRSSLEDSE